MEKFDYSSKMLKFLGSVFAMLFFCGIVYGGYLFYVFKKMPGLKAKVTGLYQLFSGGKYSGAAVNSKPAGAANAGWTTINIRTSDEKIESLSSMNKKEVAEKLDEVRDYEKFMNGNSLKLIKLIAGVLSKNNGEAVISGEDEIQIKEMLEKVIEDYKHDRIPGIDEIEKETGKW